jgi:hypothetical protein
MHTRSSLLENIHRFVASIKPTGTPFMSELPGNPYRQQTANYRRFLDSTGDISDRIRSILCFMDSLHVNLPVFLWAISWNIPDLVEDSKIRWARAALMVSDELPGILANWCRPPRTHGQGIRTKAASKSMKDWAVSLIEDTIDEEMSNLGAIMSLPQDKLSEESLLAISWKSMASEVQELAPITWKLLGHAACTTRQKRNHLKNPDCVRFDFLASITRVN